MNIFFKVMVLCITAVMTQAQPLDVNQLFNKKMVKVKEESIGTVKSFYGTIQVDETKIIDISLRFDGFITKLNANKTLMFVQKNAPLFSIYSDKVLSIYKELQVSSKINKNLYQSALDKLIALDIPSSQINAMKTQKSFQEVTMFAPSNAIVLKKPVNQGSYVKTGNQLMQLANIDKVWFIATVYQKDLSFIQKGMQARIKIDGMNKTYKSSVDYIYPFIDKKNKTVDIRFVLDNAKMKLFPNMFGEVQLKNAKKVMLTLPKTAVLTKGDKYYVFKPTSDEEFEPIAIEANRISASKYEIIEGLKAGEEVINNALFLLDSDAITNGLYEEDDDDW